MSQSTFELLIHQAVSGTGSYDPDDCLPMIEEQLTLSEYLLAEGFLGWCHENGKQFGSATFIERLQEFYRTDRYREVEARWAAVR